MAFNIGDQPVFRHRQHYFGIACEQVVHFGGIARIYARTAREGDASALRSLYLESLLAGLPSAKASLFRAANQRYVTEVRERLEKRLTGTRQLGDYI